MTDISLLYFIVNKVLKAAFISYSFMLFAEHLFIPVFALFIEDLGGNAEVAGILFGVKFLVSFIVGIFISKIKENKAISEKLFNFYFILEGVTWLFVAVFPSITTLFVAQILLGISKASGAPAFNIIISENLDDGKHIKQWGTWELIKNPSIALASILSGFIISQAGFVVLFLITSLICFLALLLFRLTRY